MLQNRFRWNLPRKFNVGTACSDAIAGEFSERTAIVDIGPDSSARATSYAQLARRSTRLASSLALLGVKPGCRIGILLPQGVDVALAHLAIYKIGAIAVPLAHVFMPQALAFRLADAEASLIFTDPEGVAKLEEAKRVLPLPALRHVIASAASMPAGAQFLMSDLVQQGNADFKSVESAPENPCLLIYTSGTTGKPKGTLHGHQVLLGHIPGFELHHQPEKPAGGIFWTPADWAWAGGLLNLLFPALYFGGTVIAAPSRKFDPERAFSLLAENQVQHAFIPPTALRMMREVPDPLKRHRLCLKSLSSAGEALGAQAWHWARDTLHLPVDEFYGQTECNYVLGSCARLGISKPGLTGKSLPGAQVAVLRADGNLCGVDEPGEIAVRRDHPSLFLEYWRQPEATAAKFLGDWMLTGDVAVCDQDGYIAFIGRNDDVITSSGYRIGPVEIEDCLLQHEAVALSAVIGKPDLLRTEIVKAFIVLREGFVPSAALEADIQRFVRERLSTYEYPREISFLKELPLTSTGKVIRRILRDGEVQQNAAANPYSK